MQEGYDLEKTVTKLKMVLYFGNHNCKPVSVHTLVFIPNFNGKSENQNKLQSISAFSILNSPVTKPTNRGLNCTQGTEFQSTQDPTILCYWPQRLLQSPPSAESLNIPSSQKVQLPTNRILNVWYLYMSATVWHIRIKHKFWNKQSLLMNSQLFPHFRWEKRDRKKIAIIWICREKLKSTGWEFMEMAYYEANEKTSL